MRLWPAVAAAGLLVLGAEASVRDRPARPGSGTSRAAPTLPTTPSSSRLATTEAVAHADAAARLAEAQDQVARAEVEFGNASPETARALAGQAYLLWTLEQYDAGLRIAERALALRLAGPLDTAELAGSRYQVADFRRATGDLAGALVHYRGAIAIWTRLHGADHVENGSAWHYIGILHGTAGDPAGARAALERALSIRARALGPGDALVASTLQALADLARRTGDPEAEPLFARAQRIWEERLGPRDPFVARSLVARARLRMESGDPAGARPLLERALVIRLEAFGPRHHLVAQTRRVRADLLARAGDIDAAVAESQAALEILEADLGPVHPHVAEALADRARLLWSAGRRACALVSALRAERMAREQFLRSSRDLDDSLALRYVAARTSGLDVLLTALVARPAGSDATGEAGEADRGAAARETVDALIRSRRMVLGAPARGSRADRDDAGLDDVRRAVPPGSALVAYARYREAGGLAGSGEPSYLAVVLRSGVAPPAVVALGPAAAIDAAVESWRAEVTRPPFARQGSHPEAAARAAGIRVRQAIWDPVAVAIGGVERVLLVPDGAIDLVPFAALPADADRFLVETGPVFHFLTAERDLVPAAGPDRQGQPAPRRAATGRGILSIGGPDFDAAPGPARDADGIRPLCPDFGALAFEPLAGSEEEAREIARFSGMAAEEIAVLGGGEATAAAFAARAPGRRILHLATHAWVLPERCSQAPTVREGSEYEAIPAQRVLLRSGLALAGANRRGRPRPGDEGGAGSDRGAGDGIVTAEEIAALDLSGVEWVVLSACDTGLGEIHAGEGVVGLRHAFERAGAATVIMSLWGADDGAARKFMRALYAARSAGAPTPEAMRQAALDLLEFQRDRGRTTHPYYWGGFVAGGDWR